MRYLMTFTYDGSNFHGYQKQKGLKTVQEELETLLTMINGNKFVHLISSGRTDALVHALNQKGHFDLDKDIKCERIKRSLNKLLKGDIYIKDISVVSDTFSARYDVKSKTYLYKINVGEFDPIESKYVYQYCKKLDLDKMLAASKYLLGEHDFASFVKKDSVKEDSVRTIYNIDIKVLDNKIYIEITGSGFMRYMVRNIVGLLVACGSGKKLVSDVPTILAKKDRVFAAKTAPACGLYLKDVKY